MHKSSKGLKTISHWHAVQSTVIASVFVASSQSLQLIKCVDCGFQGQISVKGGQTTIL